MRREEELVRRVVEDAARLETASQGCFACGSHNPVGLHMQVKRDGEGAQATVTLDPHRQGWEGVAHGGIVATLLDEIMSWSLMGDRAFFTAELTVRYRRAVPLGVPLTVRGRRVQARGRLVWAEGEIRSPEGQVLATAAGKFLEVPATGGEEAEVVKGPAPKA
jgi:uncharacterized protein (TIGR00369 family)